MEKRKRGRPRINPERPLTNAEICKRKYYRRKALGLCRLCPNKIEKETLCPQCKEELNRIRRIKYHANKDQ